MHLVALMLLAATTGATDFNLVWLAPENCATRPETSALVGDAAGHAEVQLREENGAWLVTVIFFKPEEGVRRVSAPGCEEAVRAASLLVKLGSEGALPASKPTVEPPPPPILAATEQPVEPPKTVAVPWNFSLAGGAALDVGSLPRVEPRFVLSANLSLQLLRLALDVRFGLPTPLTTQLSVHRAVEAQAAGCVNFSWRALSGGPCVAASIGSWSASASWGSSATVVATSLGAQLRGFVLIVAGLELGAVAGARFTLGRPQVFVGGVPVFATQRFVGDFQLTMGWRW